MKVEIELLNVCKYEREKDKSPRTMFNYRLLDPKSLQTESSKFKGYSVLTCYFDGYDVYDRIPANYCGKQVTLEFSKEVSRFDPSKEVSKAIKINDISLI